MRQFVSRAGQKLDYALDAFDIEVGGFICADFGANAGGFTDCLLQRGASKVFAIDTGYGALEWKLRKDPRVVTMERTNAMHVELPEKVDLVVIDVAWTRQRNILPAAARVTKGGGRLVSLIKPHYEAESNRLVKGVLPEDQVDIVVKSVVADIEAAGFEVLGIVSSPITGAKGNIEKLAHLELRPPARANIAVP